MIASFLMLLCANQNISIALRSKSISNVLDCGFEPRSSQIKEYNIVISCFSTKHSVL